MGEAIHSLNRLFSAAMNRCADSSVNVLQAMLRCWAASNLRARVTQIPFLVPLWAGISGFAETGRVFFDGEQSNRWHNAIGGGVWFSIIKPEYLVSFSLARSEDEVAFYTTLGFMF
jgi:hypothetical protein